MLFECCSMSQYRDSTSLKPFIETYRRVNPAISSLKLYSLYLNDKHPQDMKKKAVDLYQMQLGWMSLMGIPQ
jgi:hypothetical protein